MISTTTTLSGCDRAVVEVYLKIVTQPKEGAALYCPICHHRITFTDGQWHAETP